MTRIRHHAITRYLKAHGLSTQLAVEVAKMALALGFTVTIEGRKIVVTLAPPN